MIVYSVLFYRSDDGLEWFAGPWTEEWMAEAHAKENNTDCQRTIVRWQMLNPGTTRIYEPSEKRSNG